ncbi:hypothetical protein F5Y10DRAFT_270325 [Nemania abortiva]|nr:hypothetical protein F5Y10DRAFT_270325 [Nemania abortiva]
MFWESNRHKHVLNLIRRQWANSDSDHIAQLNVYHAYSRAAKDTKIDIEQWCEDHMLSYRTLEHIKDNMFQIFGAVNSVKPKNWIKTSPWSPEIYTDIRKALANGLCHNLAVRSQAQTSTKATSIAYRTVYDNQDALIAPDSQVAENRFD